MILPLSSLSPLSPKTTEDTEVPVPSDRRIYELQACKVARDGNELNLTSPTGLYSIQDTT
jgi:hypothetical protein